MAMAYVTIGRYDGPSNEGMGHVVSLVVPFRVP